MAIGSALRYENAGRVSGVHARQRYLVFMTSNPLSPEALARKIKHFSRACGGFEALTHRDGNDGQSAALREDDHNAG